MLAPGFNNHAPLPTLKSPGDPAVLGVSGVRCFWRCLCAVPPSSGRWIEPGRDLVRMGGVQYLNWIFRLSLFGNQGIFH